MILFNEDKEEVEGALTPEEAEEKIREAKEETQQELNEKVETLEGDLEDTKNLLTEAEEELEKEKGKDKNFGKVRGKVDEKEKRIKELTEKQTILETRIAEIGKGAEAGTVKQTADKLAKGNEELSKKISHYYNQLTVPEKDTEELKSERFKNAFVLAIGGTAGMGSEAIGSGIGTPPETPKGEKLSEEAKDLAGKLGVSDKTLKKHNL